MAKRVTKTARVRASGSSSVKKKSAVRRARPAASTTRAPSKAAAPASRGALPPEIVAYHKTLSAGDQRICEALSASIERHLRGAERKIWHRHPVWFLEGNPIVGYSRLKDCIRLLFWSGQSFDEPGLAPEGTFKAAEARFTEASQISAPDLKRWLGKAATIQWDYKSIVKRKGRLERLA